jgi:histidyl-tRNA synthetase
MRDFLPADVRRRQYVIDVIKDVYERYGFEPLETPAVENIETLLGKYGEEGNQLIFKILKRGEHEKTGEADLALRYDLTVPLARVVAQYQNELPKFAKRYQIQPVWRADRPARGRFREFYQCDVDVLGSKSMAVEAELCAAVSEVLTKLKFSNFTIRINHRDVLTALLSVTGIASDRQSKALIALDKLEKIGRNGVASEFTALGIDERAGNELLTFFETIRQLRHASEFVSDEAFVTKVEAANKAIIGRLVEFVGDDETGIRGIEELRKILQFVSANGTSGRVTLDPSLARGLSYYTGPIMEINVPDLAGSLGGGGRYDNLIGMFLGRDIPACGFSLGLERIIVVMTEKEMFPPRLRRSSADVLVTIWDKDSITDSLSLATSLRKAGVNVDLDLKPQKGGWYGYTRERGIPFFVVDRPEDREQGLVRLVDMRLESPDDLAVKRDELPVVILKKLAEEQR